MANSYAVNIPSIFQSPAEALQGAISQTEKDTERLRKETENYQQMQLMKDKLQREEEAKKKAYAQEKLDASKYITGIEMADDFTRQHTDELYNRLTEGDLKDLSEGDTRDLVFNSMKGITTGVNQIKKEDELFRQLKPDLKKEYPGLDVDLLYTDFKKEFGQRYIQDGKMNPNAKPSSILENISNPDFISNYVNDPVVLNKILKDKFSTEKVPFKIGTPESNVTHSGNVGFWEDINVPTPASGFYPTGTKLELVRKRGSGVINTPNGEVSIPTVTDDVYKKFLQTGGAGGLAEIKSLAKKKFNGQEGRLDYNKMTEPEKEVALKNALDDFINVIDQKGLRISDQYNKPVTKVTIPKEEKGIEGRKWIDDITSGIDNNNLDAVTERLGQLYGGKGFVKAVVNKDKKTGEITTADITMRKKVDGEDVDETKKINLRDKYRTSVLEGIYKDVMGQDVKLKNYTPQSDKTKTKVTEKSYIANGKSYTKSELNKLGYTDAQIEEAIKLGNIKH